MSTRRYLIIKSEIVYLTNLSLKYVIYITCLELSQPHVNLTSVLGARLPWEHSITRCSTLGADRLPAPVILRRFRFWDDPNIT